MNNSRSQSLCFPNSLDSIKRIFDNAFNIVVVVAAVGCVKTIDAAAALTKNRKKLN